MNLLKRILTVFEGSNSQVMAAAAFFSLIIAFGGINGLGYSLEASLSAGLIVAFITVVVYQAAANQTTKRMLIPHAAIIVVIGFIFSSFCEFAVFSDDVYRYQDKNHTHVIPHRDLIAEELNDSAKINALQIQMDSLRDLRWKLSSKFMAQDLDIKKESEFTLEQKKLYQKLVEVESAFFAKREEVKARIFPPVICGSSPRRLNSIPVSFMEKYSALQKAKNDSALIWLAGWGIRGLIICLFLLPLILSNSTKEEQAL